MIAKRLLVSMDERAKDLIVSSLELEENEIFSKLADGRLETTKQWINHEDAWK